MYFIKKTNLQIVSLERDVVEQDIISFNLKENGVIYKFYGFVENCDEDGITVGYYKSDVYSRIIILKGNKDVVPVELVVLNDVLPVPTCFYPKKNNSPTFPLSFIKKWLRNPIDEIEVNCKEDFFHTFDGNSSVRIGHSYVYDYLNQLVCFVIGEREELKLNIEKELLRQIEEAAVVWKSNYGEFLKKELGTEELIISSFIQGATSEEAKNYWFEKFKKDENDF